MRVTLDTSVLVGSVSPDEQDHADCAAVVRELVRASKAGLVRVILPAVWHLEFFSVHYRVPTDRAGKKVEPRRTFSAFDGNLNFDTHAADAEDVGAFLSRHGDQAPLVKRGGDLLFLCTADRFNTILISRDAGILAYAGRFSVEHPRDFLAKRTPIL